MKITIEVPEKVWKFAKRLGRFIGKDPRKLLEERALMHIESLPYDLAEYLP